MGDGVSVKGSIDIGGSITSTNNDGIIVDSIYASGYDGISVTNSV